jgi:hypothetical protein
MCRACDRYRAGSELHRRTGNSLADYTKRFPDRNPGVAPDAVASEPHLLGSLPALDPRFRAFIESRPLWQLAGACLSVDADSVVYHFA